MSGYAPGPILQPDQRPWPLDWESDPAIDLCTHRWERVHLLADGCRRLFEDDVVRCALCHAPRCGETTCEDPCMDRRHHYGVHIFLSGAFAPLGGYLRPQDGV